MAFKPLNTKDSSTNFRKVCIFGHAGAGKTTQATYYQKHYGPGFIVSGEAGLLSVRSAGIDYLPFSSFDGITNEKDNQYSFLSIVKMMMTPEFKAAGYKWVMLDSITELSDMIMAWATAKAEKEAAEKGKKVNGFDKYADYQAQMIGACKFFRDLPYHVVLSALAKETEDDNGARETWPSVHSNKVAAQIPGIFDYVFGLHTYSEKDKEGKAIIKRAIITDKVNGWQCKARDETHVLQPVEHTGNVVDLLKKLGA